MGLDRDDTTSTHFLRKCLISLDYFVFKNGEERNVNVLLTARRALKNKILGHFPRGPWWMITWKDRLICLAFILAGFIPVGSRLSKVSSWHQTGTGPERHLQIPGSVKEDGQNLFTGSQSKKQNVRETNPSARTEVELRQPGLSTDSSQINRPKLQRDWLQNSWVSGTDHKTRWKLNEALWGKKNVGINASSHYKNDEIRVKIMNG